jgi:hypothetical protein
MSVSGAGYTCIMDHSPYGSEYWQSERPNKYEEKRNIVGKGCFNRRISKKISNLKFYKNIALILNTHHF